MSTDREHERHRRMFANGPHCPGELINGLSMADYMGAEARLGMVAQCSFVDHDALVTALVEDAQTDRVLAHALPGFLSRLCGFTEEEVASAVALLEPYVADVVDFPLIDAEGDQ